MTTIPSALLDAFLYKDMDEVTSKLLDFALVGHEGIHVVADFDLTLTAGKRPGENAGTWDVMDALMPPEGVERHRQIYESFRPIELAGELTDEVTKEKWSETLDLICSYDMHIDDIERAFLSVAALRQGAAELFQFCKRSDIPTVILSAGISNVIHTMVRYYGLEPDHILGTHLTVRDDGSIGGWQKDSLIHMLNKKEMGHSELSSLRGQRSHVVLLGDVPDDAKMVVGDTVIRIRVLDPRKGETYDKAAALEASFRAGYDLAVEDSLEPVVRLVDWLGAGR